MERSRFHSFLGLVYPAPEHAARGLCERRISPAQAAEIRAAHRRRVKPPWDTPLGGAVGIHGGGSGLDWTRGCIALESRAAEELFKALPLGTLVVVNE